MLAVIVLKCQYKFWRINDRKGFTMGFYFRKSFKVGPARINLSKSGIGWSIGTKGFRFGHRAGSGRKRTSSNSAERSGNGFWGKFLLFILAVVAVVFAVSLVIALVKEFWPWLLGAIAVITAAIVGWKIYRHYKAANMCGSVPTINDKE